MALSPTLNNTMVAASSITRLWTHPRPYKFLTAVIAIQKFRGMVSPMPTMRELQDKFSGAGRVVWIGLREARREPPTPVGEVRADPDEGLMGDHYSGGSGQRHVTLIDSAHLEAVAGYLGRDAIDPGLVRRNIVVSGLNLLALKAHKFRIGEALLEFTDPCHPCSRMEEGLGPGGYNAMRGHGGICARVLQGGWIRLGDKVKPEPAVSRG